MDDFAIRTFMNGLEDILVPLGICVILPLTIVWMYIRKRMNETNQRTQIVLSVIEKNPDVDIQEYLRKLNPPKKSLKEKLMTKLLGACVLMALGLASCGYATIIGIIGGSHPRKIEFFAGIGAVLLLLGIAFLVVYLVSKKTMAQELEAENKPIEQ